MAEISFACPHCNQKLEAPDDMAGQTVECPACQKPMAVPGAAVTEPVVAPVAANVPAGKTCPECNAAMDADAVLCMACGFHTKLRKKISTDLR